MKTFEIVDKGNKRFVLTVTPNRVTIKLQEGSSEEDKLRVGLFLAQVANQPELSEPGVAFRGRTDIAPTNIPLMIQMVNDCGSIKHTYRENQFTYELR